jgi:hypothetical protein
VEIYIDNQELREEASGEAAGAVAGVRVSRLPGNFVCHSASRTHE